MPLIEVGSQAPSFSLRDQSGKSHSLSDYRGRTVILYFYPEDDTPLCTAQACQFRDHHPDFTKIKATILGISPQGASSHQSFASKHALPFTLLSDEPRDGGAPPVCTLYGVWGDKSMYGKTVTGMMRTTYLIDPQGKIARRWDRVKTPGHAVRVLEAVRALHRGEKLTLMGRPRPIKKSGPSRQKTRTQAGHSAYSGVNTSRSKKSMQKSIRPKVRAGTVRSAVKARGLSR